MLITVSSAGHAEDRRRRLRGWCNDNGFNASEVAEPYLVDTRAGTITLNRFIPVDPSGDADFPEIRHDDEGLPATEPVVMALQAGLPPDLIGDPQGQPSM